MNSALMAGLLAGVVGLFVFLTVHHLWIKPIWFILPPGLLIAALGGLVVGWAYAEIKVGLPPRPWTALALFGLIGLILTPAILLAQFRPPLDLSTGAIIDGSSAGRVIIRVVSELLLTATLVGGLAGWWLGGTRRAAVATAVAGFVFALGPGHNIPLLGNTPAVAKGIVLLALITPLMSACQPIQPVAIQTEKPMNTEAPYLNDQVPTGWFLSGSQRDDYVIRLDRRVQHSGTASGLIEAKPSQHAGFGTIMQNIKADAYRGKRVRLSAYIKSEQIGEWAGLWMRVDRIDAEILSFDNMENRKITGTTEWMRYAIVLDVPEESVLIAFGLLLGGRGQAWLDDVQLEVVGPAVASTNQPIGPAPPGSQEEQEEQRWRADYAKALPEKLKRLPTTPVNLDFELP